MPTVIPPFSNVPAPNDDVKSAWAQQLTQYAVDHVNDPVDAHDASAISFAPIGTISATTVQEAIVEVQTEIGIAVIPDGDKGDITVSSGQWTIDDGAVTTPDLADGAVTSLKIAPGNVNELHLADGAVTEDKIADAAVTALKIADDAITGLHIADDAVTAANIADGAVTTVKIADDVVTNAKLAPVAQNTFKGRRPSSDPNPEDLTPAQARSVLSSDDGNPMHVLHGDGTWAALPPGSPGGTDNQVQFNDAGLLNGATNVEIIDGNLALNSLPAFPTLEVGPGRTKIVSINVGSYGLPFVLNPGYGNKPTLLPPGGWGHSAVNTSWGGSSTVVGMSALSMAGGAANTATPADTNVHTRARRVEYLNFIADPTAVAGVYSTTPLGIMPSTSGGGGILASMRWGPCTGMVNNLHRAFCGFTASNAAPTDVQPSSLVNMFGMGWDSADANISFMYNDASGTATKTPLGVTFPKPSIDRTEVWESIVFIPWASRQIGFMVVNHKTGAIFNGSAATNIPLFGTLMYPRTWMSVGGNSNLIGISLMGWDFWSAL